MSPSFAGQAQVETAQAYRPAFQQNTRQANRVRNLDRKFARDEGAYRNWLANTQRQMAAAQQERDAQLAHVEQGFHADLVGSLGATRNDAAARAAQVGGPGVGGPSGVQVGQEQSATAESANLGSATIGRIGSGSGLLASVSANNLAFLAAKSAARRAQTLDAISKLADQRGDLTAKQAADTAKRAADLQAAAAAEAWKQLQFNAQEAYRTATLAQGNRRLDISAATARENIRSGRVKNQLARRRLAAAGRGGGITRTQRNAAQTQLAKGLALLQAPPKVDARGKETDPVPAVAKPNSKGIKKLSRLTVPDYASWLSGKGIPPAIAKAAAWQFLYPDAKLPGYISGPLRKNHGI